MESRIEIINGHYAGCDEDGRLNRSRHGQMEYLTTMHYIHRFAKPGTNGALETVEERKDFAMSDADFVAFADWYLGIAEKRELLGTTCHLLYICRKN